MMRSVVGLVRIWSWLLKYRIIYWIATKSDFTSASFRYLATSTFNLRVAEMSSKYKNGLETTPFILSVNIVDT